MVDSTFPADVASVVLPPMLDTDGEAVREQWEGFAVAERLERESIQLLEEALADVSGIGAHELDASLLTVADTPPDEEVTM